MCIVRNQKEKSSLPLIQAVESTVLAPDQVRQARLTHCLALLCIRQSKLTLGVYVHDLSSLLLLRNQGLQVENDLIFSKPPLEVAELLIVL